MSDSTTSSNVSFGSELLNWIVTPIHLVLFGAILCFFHPVLVLARFLFGQRAFQAVLEFMNWLLIQNMRLSGAEVTYEQDAPLPSGRPIIIVANHQGMYDIPFLVWHLRSCTPHFISKRELGRKLPSISFALRHGGHLLIDRKDPASAIPAIKERAAQMEHEKTTVAIFPEGTRGRDGVVKTFKVSGLRAMLEACPSGVVLPVAIDGTWLFLRRNLMPVTFGVHIGVHVLSPIEPRGREPSDVIQEVESKIRKAVADIRHS